MFTLICAALEATRRLIDAVPTRNIPADNRTLVEGATHSEALDAIAQAMGEAWVCFGNEVDGGRNATGTIANLHALDFARHFGDQLFPMTRAASAAVWAQPTDWWRLTRPRWAHSVSLCNN